MVMKGTDSVRTVQILLRGVCLAIAYLSRIAIEVLEWIYRFLGLKLINQFVRKESLRLPIRAFSLIRPAIRNTPATSAIRQADFFLLNFYLVAVLKAKLLKAI